jgi:hypothetical protein
MIQLVDGSLQSSRIEKLQEFFGFLYTDERNSTTWQTDCRLQAGETGGNLCRGDLGK